MALVWTVYGIGLKGPAANWVVKSTIVGNVAQSGDPQVANFPRGWKPLKLDNPEAAEFLKELIPMRRVGDPVEVANGILFLASDEASYITGSVMPVEGGQTVV